MDLFSPAERQTAQAVSALVYRNPFSPERIEAEKTILGDAFEAKDAVWSFAADDPGSRANLPKITERIEALCQAARGKLAQQTARISRADAGLYEDLAIYTLYYRHHDDLERLCRGELSDAQLGPLYTRFAADFTELLSSAQLTIDLPDPAHLFSCFLQIRQAFDQIFHSIVGTSLAAARLRADVWQSIFTHNARRYRRSLYAKSTDFTTLIVGESGTGKELVARAIALSRYIPFDPKKKAFAHEPGLFLPLNLSALSPTLVESELFGHRRGTFTGAIEDRIGYLQACPAHGTVFLDEIGDLDPAIQVKLLRVLQGKTFNRLGETRELPFKGKLIAATNRNIAGGGGGGGEGGRGEFRADLYYRLCSDMIQTPSLREQIAGDARELAILVSHITTRLMDNADDASELCQEVLRHVNTGLGWDYPWPGNFRELEQCVRNVLIRGKYVPAQRADRTHAYLDGVKEIAFTADELVSRYCLMAYEKLGSYEAAAGRLKMDRRTLRTNVGKLSFMRPSQNKRADSH